MEKADKKGKEGIQLTIIERIEALMDENNTNQAALSRKIGIGQAQLSKCLSRKSSNYISIDTLIKISDCFNVSVDHLLGRSSLKAASKPRSNAEICRNLFDLIETGSVNIMSATVEEKNNRSNKGNGKNPYRVFYFSNFFSSNGQYNPKSIEINAFIEYYLKLLELYKKGDLPKAFFEQAMEDRLNQMRY